MKLIDPTIAAKAYANNQTMAAKPPLNVAEDEGVTFSDFLKDKASDSINTMREGEKMSAKAVTGEADIVDVVQAVTNAELTLNTIVAVRDRMISAYQEIMRMPI